MLKKQDILFVDGYNLIGAWPSLAKMMHDDQLIDARDALLFELSNFKKLSAYEEIILVFDAHLVPGITSQYHQYDLTVVFTKEDETADSYIEREVSQYINPRYRVVVATSDSAEQWLIFQKGAYRKSSNELWLEIQYAKQNLAEESKRHYSPIFRRRIPWKKADLIALNHLRQSIESLPDEDDNSRT